MGRYRDQRITVRLTEDEKEILYRQMKRAGNRNVSDFIMTAACTHRSTVIDTSPILEIKGELSRIGNNVNQIAKVANTTHSIFAEDVDTLGTAYEENSLHIRCANQITPQNRRKQPYTKILTRPMSKAKYLMLDIDSALHSSKDFDGFLRELEKMGIEVKRGKYLALKPNDGKRFRRVDKLGEEYTEEMLRLYFDDKAEYKARKVEINKLFGLLNKAPKDQFNRYIAVENINTRIKMMNYMSEHNIKSQEELLSKIETAERHRKSIEKELNWLNARLDRKQSLVTVRYYYRKNKDIYRRYEAITDPTQKEIFKSENSREINRYLRAIAIMNHEKEKNGNLPTTKERNREIEKIKQKIAEYKEMLKETQSELSQLEILYENLYDMAHPTEYKYEVEIEEYEEPVRTRNRGYER